ncbi:hypothetical protein T12_12304 [Trichinella patagoniensis]|uniref:Uncharacterized protein n=1 Tax=Trichinella patagoniensis TaxID=990121 RepID=A0A0V0Z8T7_9BILA|nr:hypothetical protein T12_12304 [Trichinella patagoniensis]
MAITIGYDHLASSVQQLNIISFHLQSTGCIHEHIRKVDLNNQKMSVFTDCMLLEPVRRTMRLSR